jgi:predicted AAA+ superfamily ATPase
MLKTRILYETLEAHLEKKAFTILTGARQTGKTSILKLLHNHLVSKNRKVVTLTLEDSQLCDTLDQQPENLFNYTDIPKQVSYGETLSVDEKLYVLIDEIQYLKNPSNFLKLLYDTYADSLKLVVTGSSAFYLDRNFTDSLAGRKQLFWLKTLNFEEFLHFNNANYLADELLRLRRTPETISPKNAELRIMFNEYLTYGGYPAVVLQQETKDKIAMLADIKNAYIKRDIHESNINNEAAFMNLMRLLAAQCGSLANRNELSKLLKIDNKTVDNYLYVLQKCFHIELLRPFTGNIRKEITKMPKVYFYDLGLRNSLLNRFEPIHNRDDKGVIAENYLFQRLAEQYEPDRLNFWRTIDNHEVDFVVSDEYQKGKAYEIKYNTAILKPKKYALFTENLPNYPLYYVSAVEQPNALDLIRI